MEPKNESSEKKQPESPLREKSFLLAIRIVRLCRILVEEKKEYVISKQLVRSGTNPGAMVREAANAESGLDFIHKLAIAQKETGETQYWLELMHATDVLSEKEFQSIFADTEEIMKLLRSSILTKKKNLAAKGGAIFLALICALILL
ncbi:MAG: four helix bundle protein [Lewinellaceae bacterium]|nr:four helix bundle protein [Lewinellaceae bacterium]